MVMVDVDYGRLHADSQPKSFGCTGVGGRLAPFYIYQINHVNSRNDDSTIKTGILCPQP